MTIPCGGAIAAGSVDTVFVGAGVVVTVDASCVLLVPVVSWEVETGG